MLVCPHCQFENPNSNKSCQECGTSLTQNTCPSCNSLVPFDAVNCQECGQIAGVVWWAIATEAAKNSSTTASATPPPIPAFLDPQQRYRVIELLSVVTGATTEKQIRVLDCQPFQLSSLEKLLTEQADRTAAELANKAGGVSGTASVPMAETSQADGSALDSIPLAAQPYLALQGKFYQALPAIHDAWQQDGQQVLLLEERSQLPLLLDSWLDDQLLLPQLQVLHWLYEMVELWHVLEPLNCQQSLLEADNLRIDEDQAICLQRLYPVSGANGLSLKDLGCFWQTLFAKSQRTQLGSIISLVADVESGRLTTTSDIKARIEAIANDLQDPDDDDLPSTANGLPATTPPEPATALETAEVGLDVTAAPRLEIPPEELVGFMDDDDSSSDDLPTVVLPMQLFNLEDVGRTDIGRQRDHNEDYFGIETQISRLESPSGKTMHVRNLYILCDGMGGHAGGEVASALAVDTLRQFFKEKWQASPFATDRANKLPPLETMMEAVQLANKAIYDVNQKNARSGSGRMGTTLVLVLVHDTEVVVAHVGDSRLYRYTRKRGLEQITVDHEVGQREIQRGVDPELAYARPDAYQLTQALGPRDENFIKPDVRYFELNEDTLLLLCSDGLSDNDLLEKHAKTSLEPLLSSSTNLDQGVSQLIDLANQYNGHDNITAIAIRAKVRPNLDHLR